MKKQVVIILNGISSEKKVLYNKFLPALQAVCDVRVDETKSKQDAIHLASDAVDKNVDLILAAGGDGTINQVLNGILQGREEDPTLPVLGILPLGTANDFAKTVNIIRDADLLARMITGFKTTKIDIGRITCKRFDGNGDAVNYFVNTADLGIGPEVVTRVANSGKPFGPAIAYYQSIVSTFLTYKSKHVKAVSADWTWEGKLRTMAIANGKYYGQGLCVAPDAKVDDRMFNAFICGDVSVLDFLKHSNAMERGRHVEIPEVEYKTTTSVELYCDEDCMIEGDGEIFGILPAKVELLNRQLEFLI